MDPLWNTLVVAGIEQEEKNNKNSSTAFIGIITQRVCVTKVASMRPHVNFFFFHQENPKLIEIAQRELVQGVAYTTDSVATGMGAMLLNQLIETEYRKTGKITRKDAEEIAKKAVELAIYHDCMADNDFEIGTVDAEEGVTLGKQVGG